MTIFTCMFTIRYTNVKQLYGLGIVSINAFPKYKTMSLLIKPWFYKCGHKRPAYEARTPQRQPGK